MDDEPDFSRQLGALLAAKREAAGLSQEALAVQLQHDQSYLSRIESGQRQAGVSFLLCWCSAVGINFQELAADIDSLWGSVDRTS